MLNHGHVPTAFMKTSIIHTLINSNSDSSDKNNCRPIAIVTAMSKLFELCLSKLLDTFLVTSDNQFGFKRKHMLLVRAYTQYNRLLSTIIILAVLYILVF